MKENDETLKVIGKRYMLWNIQRQVYALKLKGRTVTEEWLIDILDSLEKMQLVEEDNWDTKKYIESEIEQDMIRESKILNKRIRGLIKLKENSIEEDIKNAEHFIKSIKTDKEYKEDGWHGYYNKEIVELARILQHILSDYKKLQEEFKQVDRECERLEEKEVRLIEENEYYKDLLNALETYYDITEEDLEKCIKDDR